MDFSLSEDQAAIAELATRIFRDQVDDAARVRHQDSFDRDLWQTLARSGLTGLGLSEANGGSGMGFVAQCLVAQALAQLDVAPATTGAAQATPTQAHDLIRNPQEYGELFAMAAAATTPPGDLFA